MYICVILRQREKYKSRANVILRQIQLNGYLLSSKFKLWIFAYRQLSLFQKKFMMHFEYAFLFPLNINIHRFKSNDVWQVCIAFQ